MRIKLICKWYDFWVGMFIDTAKRRIYILPIPFIGVCIEMGPKWEYGVIITKSGKTQARRNRWSGEVEILLWPKGSMQGDYIYTEDFWHLANTDHWGTFIVEHPNYADLSVFSEFIEAHREYYSTRNAEVDAALDKGYEEAKSKMERIYR